jgi:hypothetical protein
MAAKKKVVPQKTLRAMSAAGVTKHMEGLIAAHEATASDGRLEIATALAMTSDKVTVDASTDPFTTTPGSLFTLTFNDNQVGITTADLVRTFIANLKGLLPQIATSLDQIPENPAMKIQLVVRFVRLALLQG